MFLDSWEDLGLALLLENTYNNSQKQKPAGVTFPKSPLCLDRMLPPFFTATSRVLLWSSTIDTLNSNLQTHTFQTDFMIPNKHLVISYDTEHL